MKSIKGTRTEQNLLKSFAGESQARSRYTFFAEVAKKEGYEQIAGVFMETAEQEREHAHPPKPITTKMMTTRKINIKSSIVSILKC